MSEWNIAQLNVARARAETDSPVLADFMAALDRINALADAAPGFVWRLQTESGNATDIRPSDDPLFLVNMSVWSSVDALFEFVYKTAHTQVMARRRLGALLKPYGVASTTYIVEDADAIADSIAAAASEFDHSTVKFVDCSEIRAG